jgi:hypothetical protein
VSVPRSHVAHRAVDSLHEAFGDAVTAGFPPSHKGRTPNTPCAAVPPRAGQAGSRSALCQRAVATQPPSSEPMGARVQSELASPLRCGLPPWPERSDRSRVRETVRKRQHPEDDKPSPFHKCESAYAEPQARASAHAMPHLCVSTSCAASVHQHLLCPSASAIHVLPAHGDGGYRAERGCRHCRTRQPAWLTAHGSPVWLLAYGR